MEPRTHLVFGGGGAMGSFQAGALLALLEAGVVPDALYGCSAGALNAAFLASRPDRERAQELNSWWLNPAVSTVISPGWRSQARGIASIARGRGRGLLDPRPLARLIRDNVHAHDLSELAIPVIVTTTCLDCGAARQHDRGASVDVLLASCSLPGLFPPVRLADGHLHVDGGIADGVPIQTALDRAAPQDRVFVLDCGLSAITGRPGACAGASPAPAGSACGVTPAGRQHTYTAPEEGSVGAFDVLLRSFAIARDLASRAAITSALEDPRVHVLPHIADAWAGGLLRRLPQGPRDMSLAAQLSIAGRQATGQWLQSGVPITSGSASES